MEWITPIGVYRKRKGFYLRSSEHGELGGPCKTILEALGWGMNTYGGEYVEIDTNVQLEELFEIMSSYNFAPLLHNLSKIIINGIEIDDQSFKNFVIWYAECRKRSSAQKTDPAAGR
jgi:hypothetical protein